MIQKDDYIKAKETVVEYEKQLNLSLVSCSTCYIMNRTTDNLIFVTTDKEYADKLYESGDYIMRISQLFNW
jgi:heterodisulfide reductase subunit B